MPQSLDRTAGELDASMPKRSTCRSVNTPRCWPTRILSSGTPFFWSAFFAAFAPASAFFTSPTVNLPRPNPMLDRSSGLVAAPPRSSPSNSVVPTMPSGMNVFTANAAGLRVARAIVAT